VQEDIIAMIMNVSEETSAKAEQTELAKKVLINSDRPIKDIVADIGYVDVSNFVRKFKKREGITPGRYRELYSQAK
jgi:AraC-like DNA-binding protein